MNKETIQNTFAAYSKAEEELTTLINPILNKWLIEVKGWRVRDYSIEVEKLELGENGIGATFWDYYDANAREIIPWEFVEKQDIVQFKRLIVAEKSAAQQLVAIQAEARERAEYERLKGKFGG